MCSVMMDLLIDRWRDSSLSTMAKIRAGMLGASVVEIRPLRIMRSTSASYILVEYPSLPKYQKLTCENSPRYPDSKAKIGPVFLKIEASFWHRASIVRGERECDGLFLDGRKRTRAGKSFCANFQPFSFPQRPIPLTHQRSRSDIQQNWSLAKTTGKQRAGSGKVT